MKDMIATGMPEMSPACDFAVGVGVRESGGVIREVRAGDISGLKQWGVGAFGSAGGGPFGKKGVDGSQRIRAGLVCGESGEILGESG